ncbi:MAG: heavy metal-responsive transcriptional regulator [Chloroflexia bacterium]|jgi:DNA-binding transcriptional MerR regulator|nr:heavy metal-responsive transcriptional regulator [Chloroflexia bacterium]
MDNAFTVGEIAREADVTPKTVRYYEAIGLLPPAERSPNGYRRYSAEDLNRLAFIQRVKALGLSLEEIRELVVVAEDGRCALTKAELRQTLDRKVADCTQRIEELIAFRATLQNASQQLLAGDDEQDECCPSCRAAFAPTCTCVPTLEETIP